MVTLGWLQDMHFREPGAERTDAASTWQSDYNDVINNQGATDVYLTGDMVHASTQGNRPHTPPECYDRLWGTILPGTADGGDAVKYAIPGNHETPVQQFLRSDERAVLRARVNYDSAGVTVLLVNTQGGSTITGAPGVKAGSGELRPRVPRTDLEWLDDQLNDAGSNAKLVLPHAFLYPTQTLPANVFQGNVAVGADYEHVSNWDYCHSILSKYNKAVVPQSHYYGEDDEGKNTVGGVEYVHTQHYGNDNDPATPDTYGWIDIDSSGCTVKTRESGRGTIYTPLDVTF